MNAKRLVRSAALALALAASGQASAVPVPVELAVSGSFAGMAGSPLSVSVSLLSEVDIPIGGASLELVLSIKDVDVLNLKGTVVTLDSGFEGTFPLADLLSYPDPLQPYVDTGNLEDPVKFSGGILTWRMTLGTDADPMTYPFTVSLIGRSLTDDELFSGAKEGAFTVRAMPEPSTWTLLICSVAAAGFAARRRRPA